MKNKLFILTIKRYVLYYKGYNKKMQPIFKLIKQKETLKTTIKATSLEQLINNAKNKIALLNKERTDFYTIEEIEEY